MRGIFEPCLSDEDPNTAQATLDLGWVFVSLGKHSEAVWNLFETPAGFTWKPFLISSRHSVFPEGAWARICRLRDSLAEHGERSSEAAGQPSSDFLFSQ
jgi:hypothetical protein